MIKGLEALERIKKVKVDKETPMSATFLVHDKRYCDDLSIIEKELKVLEFITNQYAINVYWTRHNNTGFEMRLDGKYGDSIFIEITKEEYDLLKEVLL